MNKLTTQVNVSEVTRNNIPDWEDLVTYDMFISMMKQLDKLYKGEVKKVASHEHHETLGITLYVLTEDEFSTLVKNFKCLSYYCIDDSKKFIENIEKVLYNE